MTRSKRNFPVAGAWLLAALSLLLLVAPGAAAKKRPPASLYWGAQIGDQMTGEAAPWDINAAYRFQELADKGLSLIEFGSPFAECNDDGSGCVMTRFPLTPLENARRYGAIPVFSWNSAASPETVNQSAFTLSTVISGQYDAYIREFATKAKEWGKPFFLRFNWEMNGDWFPWGERANGNRPGEYVRAWRHVHDIFAEVGATNPIWVWCPNVDFEDSLQDLGSLYPGDDYVEWTCLDGYNSGTNPAKRDRWRSFDQLYRRTYDEVVKQIAPTKPMVLGEIASTEQGGSKAQWIADMLAALPSEYPKVRGLVWFDKFENGMDWPIETSQSAIDAFAAGIRGPRFAAGGS